MVPPGQAWRSPALHLFSAMHRTRTALPRNVIVLSLVSLFTDASSEMIYPLIPAFLATVLGASAMSVGAIEGAAEAVASLLKVASGTWSDRLSRRKPLIVAGYALASVVRPLIGLAQVASQVFAIRVTDRIGKGLRTAPRDALIADSVAPDARGRAFGFHRAADHAGAVLGPLIAFALLQMAGLSMRAVFLLAAIPAALAVITLVVGVRETPRPLVEFRASDAPAAGTQLPRRFFAYLVILALFTLGNSTDAFLLLRAQSLGVSLAQLLWAFLHVVKMTTSAPGGALSDRLGRRPLIVAGWMVYALVYYGFARADSAWHAWLLFGCYGVFFGLTEGVEKAMVADLVGAGVRGRAFGWFHLTIGLTALPASILFGAIWDRLGAPTAFTFGAACSILAATLLLLFGRDSRERLRHA
jgi:MFS family permease